MIPIAKGGRAAKTAESTAQIAGPIRFSKCSGLRQKSVSRCMGLLAMSISSQSTQVEKMICPV